MADTTLAEDLAEAKRVEDTLQSNKVANFAYTDEAYDNDLASGVTDYDYNRGNNIPKANAEVLNVNDTVLNKGWRTEAGSITRMLMNHFLGRLSYNLNKVNDIMSNLVNVLIEKLGAPNGYASLDENGRIPFSQLPESAIEYQGNWDASTNTPPLSDGMTGATAGDFYIVNVAGTVDFGHGEISFLVNDRVIYNKNNEWEQLSGGNVRSVNSKEPSSANGNITVYGTDIKTSEADDMNVIEKINWQIGKTMLGRYWKKEDVTDYFLSNVPVCVNDMWVMISHGRAGAGNIYMGHIYYSFNGINWNLVDGIEDRFSNDNAKSDKFVYSNGKWLLSGDKGIYVSEDGIAWTLYPVEGTSGSILFENGVYVTARGLSGLFYSDNLAEGFKRVVPIDDTTRTYERVRDCSYIEGVWFAGNYGSRETDPCMFMTSSDGIHWRPVTEISSRIVYSTNDFGKVQRVNNIWLANYGATMIYSLDGEYWDTIEGSAHSSSGNIGYADGVWFCENLAVIYRSTDGIHWSAVFRLTDDFSLTGGLPVYACGIWLWCTNSKMYYSLDGINWNTSSVITDSFRSQPVYANGVWIVGSIGSKNLYYSTDGLNWKIAMSNKEFYACAVYANDRWLIAETEGNIYCSSVQDIIDNGWLE